MPPAEPDLQSLQPFIDDGSWTELLTVLDALNDKERKTAAAWALSQWKALDGAGAARNTSSAASRWERWQVVLMATAADAKKALAIPAQHWGWGYDLRWNPREPVVPTGALAKAALAQAAIARGARWCTELLAVALDAKKPRPIQPEVVLLIAQAHGIALPETPAAVETWARQWLYWMPDYAVRRGDSYLREVSRYELIWQDGRCHVLGRDVLASVPLQAVRGSFRLQERLHACLAQRDAVGCMVQSFDSKDAMDEIAATLAALVSEGELDGAALARACIAALSRNDAVGTQRLQVRLLEAAQPSTALVTEQAGVLTNLLASGMSGAASLAQTLLRRADAAAPLPDALFLDASRMVFNRKEKGLRAAQLDWAKERAAVASTVPSAAQALAAALGGTVDAPLQRQAAERLAALWPQLPEPVRAALLPEIEASQPLLDAATFALLWTACTGGAAPRQDAVAVPTPPRTGLVLEPFDADIDLHALPADVLLALGTWTAHRDPVAHERVLVAAMRALNQGGPKLAAQLLDRLGNDDSWELRYGRQPCQISPVEVARRAELKALVAAGRPRRFVSVPSWRHGGIATGALIERLAALATAGEEAPPVDLLLALLRTSSCGVDELARLRALRSPQALLAADFLAAGGAQQLRTTWVRVPALVETNPPYRGVHAKWQREDRDEVAVRLSAAAVRPLLDGVPMDWALGFEPERGPYAYEWDALPHWLAPLLPYNAEALAALQLYGFRRAGLAYDTDGGKAVVLKLPEILRAHGEAGPALHLAVLYAMSANDAPARLVGSDAMVSLLQQGRWNALLAGELAAECIDCGSVKPARLATALAPVREAGEWAAVWALLRAAIPAALQLTPPPPGAADLMALGTDLAGPLGDREPLPALETLVGAIKGKPNKLQEQARRLRAALQA
jgi:hypothetical protein